MGRLKEEIARLREEVVSLKGRLERSKRQTDANRASMELWTSMNAGAGGEGGGGDFSLNLSSASSRGARGGRATAVALSAGEEEMDKLRGKVRSGRTLQGYAPLRAITQFEKNHSQPSLQEPTSLQKPTSPPLFSSYDICWLWYCADFQALTRCV